MELDWSQLVFIYAVQSNEGQDTTDLAVTGLSLNGGAINGLSTAVTSDLNLSVDTTSPTLLGITNLDSQDPLASVVHYKVTFSEPVKGVSASDFSLATTGTLGSAQITGVTPVQGSNGAAYTVTVATGPGAWTLRLDLLGSAPVRDLANNGLPGGAFFNGTPITTGTSQPSFVEVADLNGDDRPDLLVANRASGSVSVFLGNGGGTFTAEPTVTGLDGSPAAVAVGDFNNDGKLDFVATGGTSKVEFGNGDGTFTAGPTVATGNSPYGVAVADFNGDGNQNLIFGDISNSELEVHLGNGDGTFQNNGTIGEGSAQGYVFIPIGITTADVTGNGFPTIIVADGGNDRVQFYNTYNGSLGPLSILNTGPGSNPYTVVIGDLNGDGKTDLVVANAGTHTVGVYLGNGSGGFTAEPAVPLVSSAYSVPVSVTVGDVNGDGIPDIVATDPFGSEVSVAIGNGDGTFETPFTVASGAYSQSVALVDVNGDGRPDLVTANRNDNTVSVLLNQSQAQMGSTHTVGQPAATITSVAATMTGNATHLNAGKVVTLRATTNEPVTVDWRCGA
ncbi:MAG TPA: VCBS repeat-containing protein [Lichenihabitans sp.]|jgi:hypothetical protein|nr:VCBS repeat-containing protein [Lichenihabitans sp.]